MARHNERPADQSSFLHDDQLQKLVSDACARIHAKLTRHAPFLGEQVRGWMAQLSPTGNASDYFLLPRMFPLLRLPLWVAKSFAAEAESEFLADVIYSTVNGYYYIRLLDNLMDGHGTNELEILPATAFFHTEFQATYQKYFEAAHPFWEMFRSAWFSASDAVTHEFNLDCIREAEFEGITVATSQEPEFHWRRWVSATELPSRCEAGKNLLWRWRDGRRWKTICSTGITICNMTKRPISLPRRTAEKALIPSMPG